MDFLWKKNLNENTVQGVNKGMTVKGERILQERKSKKEGRREGVYTCSLSTSGPPVSRDRGEA